MKIAMVNLTGGGMSGGYRKYLRNIIPLLRSRPEVEEVDVFVPPQVQELIQHGWLSWPDGSRRRQMRWLNEKLSQSRPDVVFIPTARRVRYRHAPVVVMVRNMEPLAVPWDANPLPEALRNVARAFTAWNACHASARVMAVSSYVKEFLTVKWSIPAEKVGVVYHGIESPPHREQTRRPASFASDRRFVFAAGSIRPARGLEELLRGFAQAAPKVDVVLAIAGRVDPGMQSYSQRLRRLSSELGVDSRIFWLGELGGSEMSWCFYHCAAFMMSSRAEACPNTVLEALSHGALSISVDRPPLPEFYRDAAQYYRGGSPASLASAMVEILNAPEEDRKRMQEQSKRRAADFTWEKTAEETVKQLSMATATQRAKS